ncbi:ATP-binding cassette domain-containing protein [Mycoplasmopsis agassizii]|uniref:ABC transporter ATP-binding protein n=1 Tax=Mycoplasmopsis agassizii TaxID=33922 RepID=A0ABX4H6M3_9BACT|nr:ABC transporter ATP-binding protein [Mycoplasmopsis agassizii]PAF55508.1 ABC transporter ATP-binding protein [Mycoplasmopsis agassizii]SMC18006.1 ABC-type multidrug transport system, ATPase and permease component [Mycoplasmopsis agassizii]
MKYFFKNKLLFWSTILVMIITVTSGPVALFFLGRVFQTYVFANGQLVNQNEAIINIIVLFALTASAVLFGAIWIYLRINLIKRCIFYLREDISSKISNISLKKLSDSSSLSAIYTNNVEQVKETFFRDFLNLIHYSATFIVAIVLMSIIWIHLLWISVIVILLGLLITILTQGITQKSQVLYQQSESKYVSESNKIFNSHRVFWFNSKQNFFKSYLLRSFANFKKGAYRSFNFQLTIDSIVSALVVLVQFSTLIASILIFYFIPGQFEVGFLVSILGLSGTLISAFSMTLGSVFSVKAGKALFKVFDIEQEPKLEDLKTKVRNIKVSNLTFNNGERDIFKNDNFVFETKKKYLIKGASGSGKSLLLKFILGMNENEESNILVNDQNLKQLSKNDFLKQLSYLTNDAFLFDDSVINNILVEAKFDKNRLQIICNILEISDTLLKATNTAKLSSGEKQKISLARELYKNKEILVIDEAFSNLDRNVKIKLNDFLTKQKDLTLIVIAHHLEEEIERGFDEIIAIS